MQFLIEKGADVNAQGGFYGNALQAVSSEGHEKPVHLLVEKGADVSVQGGHHGNALQAASQGADENAQAGNYGNALHGTSKKGYEEVVQLLINHGANFESI